MNRRLLICTWVLIWIATPLLYGAEGKSSALAAYVQEPDDSYGWQVRREGKLGSTSYAELILTSQTWRDIVWKHQLFLIKPAALDPANRQALLFIAGSSWKPELEQPPANDKLPGEANLLAAVAEQLRSPVAILLHVPHQPIFDGKHEDQIIAYTFEEYIKTGDPHWPLLLPMVKSAVRGMDATQEYAAQKWDVKIDAFTVTGASKRGWTTWLTSAVDPRVQALAPMVIDILNMAPQMRHQKATWGEFSEQISDYTERGLQGHLESERGAALREIVDPYSYRDQLQQPKFIMLGTNDRYWPLDALNLYWDGLPGPKYILYVPNNGHGLKDYGRLTGSLIALHQHAAGGRQLPELKWQFDEREAQLSLTVNSDIAPQKVEAWIASAATRDFREATWTSRPARRDGDHFLCELPVPEKGFAAMFAEAVYDGEKLPFFLSTNVRIVGTGASAVGE